MIIYAILQHLILQILTLVVFLSKKPKLARFVELRLPDNQQSSLKAIKENLEKIQASQNKTFKKYWLHVASAGELEQAIPLMRKLSESGEIKFLVTYFSPSTEPFLKNISGAFGVMGFPLDTPKNHLTIIDTLGISDVFLVRYDLWPALISTCRARKISLHLLAATRNSTRQGFLGKVSAAFKLRAYRQFQNIFAVTSQDAEYFKSLALPAHIAVAGDPKWARAKERADHLREQGSQHRLAWFSEYRKFQCQRIDGLSRMAVVFGSPHKEEHEVALRALELKDRIFSIYVPHEVGAAQIDALVAEIRSQGVAVQRFSELQQNTDLSSPPLLDCLVIDRIGFLAELYAQADLAIVGGGFDGQVHNTLEPAAHPVPTIFGDNLARAQEAQTLVREGAALAFASPEDMFYFLRECSGFDSSSQSDSLEPKHKLAEIRLKARSLFAQIPNTSEVVLHALALESAGKAT